MPSRRSPSPNAARANSSLRGRSNEGKTKTPPRITRNDARLSKSAGGTHFSRVRRVSSRWIRHENAVNWNPRTTDAGTQTSGTVEAYLGLGHGFRAPAGGENAADEHEREAEQHPCRQVLAEEKDAEKCRDGRVP